MAIQSGQAWDEGSRRALGAQRRYLARLGSSGRASRRRGNVWLCCEESVGAIKTERWKRVPGQKPRVEGSRGKVNQGYLEDGGQAGGLHGVMGQGTGNRSCRIFSARPQSGGHIWGARAGD